MWIKGKEDVRRESLPPPAPHHQHLFPGVDFIRKQTFLSIPEACTSSHTYLRIVNTYMVLTMYQDLFYTEYI
jgi:hypothetical protein